MQNSGCQLVLQESDGSETSLLATNTDAYKRLIPSKVQFRIVPFDANINYIQGEGIGNITNNLGQQGVRVFLHLYSPYYQPI